MAVFNNFAWDTSVRDSLGHVSSFSKINVIYGWNYSGKTTLSRIIRALETGLLSDKYDSPEFIVNFEDGTNVTQNNLSNYGKSIRVYNEDFVKDKLRCFSNPEDSIEPFTVMLGQDNIQIKTKIQSLEKQLGSNEKGQESGLYGGLKIFEQRYMNALNEYEEAENSFNKLLSEKATGKKMV